MIEGMWVINECGLTRGVQVRRLRRKLSTTVVDGVSSLGALVLIPPKPVMTGSAMNQQYQGRLRGHDLMMREMFLVWVLERSRGKTEQLVNSAYSEQASQSPNRAL